MKRKIKILKTFEEMEANQLMNMAKLISGRKNGQSICFAKKCGKTY